MCMTSVLTKILEISLKNSGAPCQFFRSKVSRGYGPPAFPFARHLLSVHPSTGKIRTLNRRLQHSSTCVTANLLNKWFPTPGTKESALRTQVSTIIPQLSFPLFWSLFVELLVASHHQLKVPFHFKELLSTHLCQFRGSHAEPLAESSQYYFKKGEQGIKLLT